MQSFLLCIYIYKVVLFQETAFVEELFEDKGQMQGLANNCSSIMAWRLEIEAPMVPYPKG